MNGRSGIRVPLESIPAIPEVQDLAEASRRLRAVADRFGLNFVRLGDGGTRDADDRAPVVVVRWARHRLRRPGGDVVVLQPSPEHTPSAPDLPSARLQRRPRRRERDPAPTPSSSADRWAILVLGTDGTALSADESTMLRRFAAAIDAEFGAPLARPRPAERSLLSPRERECLQWTAAGKTTWEISGILAISQNTIDGYISAAARKLGAVNRTQAVAEALRRGLID